jgi:hypothetical protein
VSGGLQTWQILKNSGPDAFETPLSSLKLGGLPGQPRALFPHAQNQMERIHSKISPILMRSDVSILTIAEGQVLLDESMNDFDSVSSSC